MRHGFRLVLVWFEVVLGKHQVDAPFLRARCWFAFGYLRVSVSSRAFNLDGVPTSGAHRLTSIFWRGACTARPSGHDSHTHQSDTTGVHHAAAFPAEGGEVAEAAAAAVAGDDLRYSPSWTSVPSLWGFPPAAAEHVRDPCWRRV